MTKINCWNFKKCGREPSGMESSQAGTCAAAIEEKCNEINHGRNGGRACWFIRQRMSEKKDKSSAMIHCSRCDFYKLVEKEEGVHFFAYQ